jgi:hypothetical protein
MRPVGVDMLRRFDIPGVVYALGVGPRDILVTVRLAVPLGALASICFARLAGIRSISFISCCLA